MTIHVFGVEMVENALAYCLLDLSVGLFPRSTGSVNTLCSCITLLLFIGLFIDMWVRCSTPIIPGGSGYWR